MGSWRYTFAFDLEYNTSTSFQSQSTLQIKFYHTVIYTWLTFVVLSYTYVSVHGWIFHWILQYLKSVSLTKFIQVQNKGTITQLKLHRNNLHRNLTIYGLITGLCVYVLITSMFTYTSSAASTPVTTAQAPAQEPIPLSSGQQPGVETSTTEQPTVGGEGITAETRHSQNGEHTFLV